MSNGYSQPDADGVCTQKIDIGVKRTLKGRRKRRSFDVNVACVQTWPKEWRSVLIKWLKTGDGRKKYQTLMRAGKNPISLTATVFDTLLKNGLIEIEEVREHGRWSCLWVEFTDTASLRTGLGLEDASLIAKECTSLADIEIEDAHLNDIFQKTLEKANKPALNRGRLILKLNEWQLDSRIGTRREFALFSRNDTKGITKGEWAWLEGHVDLEYFNISKHTPMLLMKGPVQIGLKNGGIIDVSSAHEFIGITPKTLLLNMTGIQGHFNKLRLLENQTTFEHVARKYGDMDLVIWLPGYPPSWWQECMRLIGKEIDCHVLIAADPDPSGIEIALTAGSILENVNLTWEPWHMSTEDLKGLPTHKDITKHDLGKLKSLRNREMHHTLTELMEEIIETGLKGEQEGILM